MIVKRQGSLEAGVGMRGFLDLGEPSPNGGDEVGGLFFNRTGKES